MQPPPEQLADIHEDDLVLRAHLNTAAAGLQLRGNRLPPLLTGFFIHQAVSLDAQPWLRELYPGKRLPNNNEFPPGARILSFSNDDTGVMVLEQLQWVCRWNLWHICSKPATQITLLRDVWLWTVTLKKQPNV